MSLLSRILAGTTALFRRNVDDRDLEDELRSYRYYSAQDKMRLGLADEQAQRAARVEMGSMEALKDRVRDAGWESALHSYAQDIRYALRMLRKAPGFSLVAVLTLGLGIGVNSAIFSVVDAVLLRPLPYAHPDRLVVIGETAPGNRGISVAYPNYLDWKSQNQVFENLAAFNQWGVVLSDRGHAERASAWFVSANFLRTLGVPVARGRDFSDADERTASPVVLLTEGYWKRHFGGDAAVLNRSLVIDDKGYTVIGVLPASFRAYFSFSSQPDIVLPFAIPVAAAPADWMSRSSHAGTAVIARLKPGVSLEAARANLQGIAANLEKQYPDTNSGKSVRMQPVLEDVAGEVRPALLILLAAVGAVLLIACTNLANLQLARSTGRTREIAVRIALGARRSRLIRQLLTESLVLSILGGALGVFLAWQGVSAIIAASPQDLPRLDALAVNGRILAFTALLTLLTGILFGLLPAWRASAPRANSVLNEVGRSGGLSRSGKRLRHGLVIGEMALSLLLLSSSALLFRSFLRLRAVDPGFKPDGVLTFRVYPPDSRYPDDTRRQQFYDSVLQRLQSLPGVTAVGAITPLPLSGSGWQHDYRVDGIPLPANRQFPSTDVHFVIPGYFRVMQIPLVSGRLLEQTDRRDTLPVIVINETMARRLWPNVSALGKRIRTGAAPGLISPDERAHPWWTVVGVVGDVHQYSLAREPKTEVYFPMAQHPEFMQTFTLRASVSLASLVEPVRQAIHELDPEVPVFRFAAMKDLVAESLASPRLLVWLMCGFAALAMLLAVMGIYGVIAYMVSQRTHEIGVRMALGASRSVIVCMVLSQSGRLLVVGVGLGFLASYFSGAALRTQLFGVAPHDLVTTFAVAALLSVVALLASALPARRASRVDPGVALRAE